MCEKTSHRIVPMRGLHDDIVSKNMENVKRKPMLFSSVLFYDIISLLFTRNPATGGGEFIWKSSFLFAYRHYIIRNFSLQYAQYTF